MPLSGVQRNCKLQVFLFITHSLSITYSLWYNTQVSNKKKRGKKCFLMKHLRFPNNFNQWFQKQSFYLYRSAILCPNHIPPFHQWSLQVVQSCLPEPHVSTHIYGDYASGTQRSYYHIRLWHFGQPVGVRRNRHWPVDHKCVGKSTRELIKRA